MAAAGLQCSKVPDPPSTGRAVKPRGRRLAARNARDGQGLRNIGTVQETVFAEKAIATVEKPDLSRLSSPVETDGQKDGALLLWLANTSHTSCAYLRVGAGAALAATQGQTRQNKTRQDKDQMNRRELWMEMTHRPRANAR